MRKYIVQPYEMVYLYRSGNTIKNAPMHRIVANIDIPLHGVKKGDLGGYVSKDEILSHEGNAWIGGNAKAYGAVKVSGNALLTGDARVVIDAQAGAGNLEVNGYAVIKDEAFVYSSVVVTKQSIITDNAEISANASVLSPLAIAGNARIYGSATVYPYCSVVDNARVGGKSQTGANSVIHGDARIYGDTFIHQSCDIGGQSLLSGSAILARGTKTNDVVNPRAVVKELLSEAPPLVDADKLRSIASEKAVIKPGGMSSARSMYLEVFEEISQKVSSYRDDIVNLIRYPLMSDLTNSYTLALETAMRQTIRVLQSGTDDEVKEAVLNAEEKLLAAESNARKTAATGLSEEDRKKTEKARDLFSIAVNEASTENEKRVALKQGFLQLEGVIDVPEKAIKALGVKAGLLELEA